MFKLPEELRRGAFNALLDRAVGRLQSMRDTVGLVLLCACAGFEDDKTRRPNPHVLLEGLNGTAKTTLVGEVVNALLGRPLELFYELTGWDRYARTAGSPDQSPADLVGFDQPGFDAQGRQRLIFVPGPILQDKLVHYNDEQNRSPPKSQAVWLEPMAEGGRVTVSTLDPDYRFQRTRRLTDFLLLASQNPEAQEGTFPLPEAMADRFMVKITMSYTDKLADLIKDPPEDRTGRPGAEIPGPQDELRELLGGAAFRESLEMARAYPDLARHVPADLAAGEGVAARVARPIAAESDYVAVRQIEAMLLAARRAELRALKEEVRRVRFEGGESPYAPARYASRLVYDTWSRKAYAEAVGGSEGEVPIPIDDSLAETVKDVAAGASPRAAIALRAFAKAIAWARGAAAVTPEDIERGAQAVLRHRVLLRFQSALGGLTADAVVRGVIDYRRRNRLAAR